MPSLRFYLFGPPRIEHDQKIVEIQRRKTLAIFAYLVVTRQVRSRDTIATLFWQDSDQPGARANLRREISRLKQALGDDILLLDGDNVSLNPAFDLWVDVKDYLSKLEEVGSHGHLDGSLCQRCLTILTEVVGLYTDGFMSGFSLSDSPKFDEWQFFQADGLRQSFSEALEKLIEWHTSRGEFDAAISYARRWLALDSLHEPAHRSLMKLYAWSGQQSAALRQYQECVRALREELDIEPDAETRSVYEAIRSRTLELPKSSKEKNPTSSKSQTIAEDIQPTKKPELSQVIRFCTAPDGVRLAYATVGQGPVLVKAANWLSHLEHDWSSPVWRHWMTGLAGNHTLVRYDERGCGLSDWNVNEFNLDAWVLDLETVVDTLGLERFPLLGLSQGASIAIEYAVRHPEKVSHLILYGGYMRGRLQRNPTPQQQEESEVLLQLIRIGWGREHPAFRQVFSSLFLPDGTPEQIDAFNELQRISSSPEIAAKTVQGFQHINVYEQAKRIIQPTLILHAKEDMRIPFEEGRLLAATIPNARLVSLESRNHILLENEPAWGHFLQEMDNFLKEENGLA